MTATDWLWLVGATVGPLPFVWAYRRWQAAKVAREVRDYMAERRARYGGAIKPPGQRDVTPFDR